MIGVEKNQSNPFSLRFLHSLACLFDMFLVSFDVSRPWDSMSAETCQLEDVRDVGKRGGEADVREEAI